MTWEEGTWAAWLYDLLQPQVARVLVCDPRRNALSKEGNKGDKVDARKLADLLRTGMLRPVYHGEHGLRTLRGLARRVAANPAPGVVGGESEASSHETVTADSLHRSDSDRSLDRTDANAEPLPQQAANSGPVVDGHCDPRQWAISLRARTTATYEKAAADSRSQSESQSRDERYLQGSSYASQLRCGAVAPSSRWLCWRRV